VFLGLMFLGPTAIGILNLQNPRKSAFQTFAFSARLQSDQRICPRQSPLPRGRWRATRSCQRPHMNTVSGLFLVLAGTAGLWTAHAIYSGTALNRPIPPKDVDIVDQGSATDAVRVAPPEESRGYLVAPERPQLTEAPPAPVVVTVAKRNNEPDARTSMAALDKPMYAISRDRTLLARELQRELRRLGCYDGKLNGSWTRATRAAMTTFTRRINATLPVDKPDEILLALVQGQRAQVCGVPCPSGEGLNKNGDCIPNALRARATTTAARRGGEPARLVASIGSTASPVQPTFGESADGPMMLAGPAVHHVTSVRPTAATRVARERAAAAAQRGQAQHSQFASALFSKIDALGPH